MHKLNSFLSKPIADILKGSAGEDAGNTVPESAVVSAIALYKACTQQVPAYQNFLAAHEYNSDDVQSFRDFQEKVPLIEKKNYLFKYPLPERCIGGSIFPGSIDFIHVSSGSTGIPTFWARSIGGEIAVAARFEQILVDALGADKKKTLAVVAFPLGSWVGGIFTTFCLRYVCMKGHPITIVTPGDKVPEILRCVQALSPMYEQTCILGYPPFVKGTIDAGRAQGVPWERFDLSLVLAGEVFSEEWRQLVAERAGIARPLRNIVSIYGTADAGVIGNETPLSAVIRAWLATRPLVARELFGSDRLPTLLQYDPHVRLLEVTGQGTLVLTSLDAAPSSRAQQLHPHAHGRHCQVVIASIGKLNSLNRSWKSNKGTFRA